MMPKQTALVSPTLRARNEKMRQWVIAHALLNRAAICRRIDYNRANFDKFLEDFRDLPEAHMQRLERLLKPYGYN